MSKVKCLLVCCFLFVAVFLLSSSSVLGASLDYEDEFQVATFLTQVAGIDLNEYRISGFDVSTCEVLDSSIEQTSINAQLVRGEELFSLELKLVDGRISVYSFYSSLPSSTSQTIQVSVEESLNIARQAIERYQTCFNAAYCEGFSQMIPQNVPAANATINTKSTQLNIQPQTQDSQALQLQWLKTDAASRIQQLELTLSVSKTGILSSFTDELAIYSLATANATITEEQAITIAKPYYTDYAQTNNRQIQSIKATFDYATDTGALRSNDTMMYPRWLVTAEFTETSQEGIYAYNVMLWADTGEVYSHEPQAIFVHASTGDPPNEIYLAVVVVAAAAVVIGVYLYRKSRI
ncbi:MAG: hypothetical protein NWF04_05430 [Candidatus Bathyarchaeota archaeon]|nr:hypothetical protein [Candidatus Bathyarchaeota archaeon]